MISLIRLLLLGLVFIVQFIKSVYYPSNQRSDQRVKTLRKKKKIKTSVSAACLDNSTFCYLKTLFICTKTEREVNFNDGELSISGRPGLHIVIDSGEI